MNPFQTQTTLRDSRPTRRIESILARMSLAFVAVSVFFAAMELAARVWLRFIANDRQFEHYARVEAVAARLNLPGARWSGHHYLRHIPTPNWTNGLNLHNSLGFRGQDLEIPKPSGVFRIACLGGSTTYDTGVENFRETYPARLQQHLHMLGYPHVEVLNAGVGHYSSWESLMNLQFRVLDTEPDMVILYHGINDVHPRLVWPPEAYRGDNQGSLARSTPPGVWTLLTDCSDLIRILKIRSGQRTILNALKMGYTHKPPSYQGKEFNIQKLNGTYPSGVFAKVSAEAMLRSNPPVFLERNLASMAGICRMHKVQAVFSTFAWSPAFTNEPRVSREYGLGFQEQNQMIQALSSKNDIPCFDLAGVFPTNRNLFTDGRHNTTAGADLKARLFAEFLIREGLIPTNPVTLAKGVPSESVTRNSRE